MIFPGQAAPFLPQLNANMLNWSWQPPKHVVLSPCIGICELGDDGLCRGCFRTGDEIAAWSTLSDTARLQMIEQVLPQREAQRR